MQSLYEEFKVLDKNNDGMISLDEIKDFLYEKLDVNYHGDLVQGKGEVDLSVADYIFDEIDQDDNGKVSIAEFVQAYFE